MIDKNLLPEGWFTDKDIEEYRKLFSSLDVWDTVCELGVWKGRSICSVADIILEKNLRVYCIDTFQGTENEGDVHKEAHENDLYSEFLKTLEDFNLTSHVCVYKMTTDDAAIGFNKSGVRFNLVFIDADHSTEAVYKDINNYTQLLCDDDSILAGHDFSWESVRNGILDALNIVDLVKYNGENFWWMNKKDYTLKTDWKISKTEFSKDVETKRLINEIVSPTTDVVSITDNMLKKHDDSVEIMNGLMNIVSESLYEDNHFITAVICTKDRYESLFDTVLCIALQTVRPQKLLIFDDSNNKKDLREEIKWQYLFTLLNSKGIDWEVVFTTNHGQNKNHQLSIEMSKTKYIWRVDDDLIFGNDVLGDLKLLIVPTKAGAVAPKVITPNVNLDFTETSSLIKDVYTHANIQLSNGEGVHNVEHLHCTFLYDRTLGINYHDSLSIVGHREETIFSWRMKKAGHELIVDLNTEVYHLKNPSGGIRSSEVTEQMFIDDENKFSIELHSETALNLSTPYIIYLDNGIGDHFVFKHLLPNILEQYDKVILACCYPDVFWQYLNDPKLKIVSLFEGQQIISKLGKNINDYSVYALMDKEFNEGKRNVNLVDTVNKIYNQPEKKKLIINCFPFFNEIDLLKIRLEELWSVVDYFVITESQLTHSGISKPLYLKDNLHLFEKYKSKLIIQEVNMDDVSDWSGPVWGKERFQRNIAKEILKNIASDEDYVIISDADEIPKVDAIIDYILNPQKEIGIILLDRFMYYYNYRDNSDNKNQLNATITQYKHIKNVELSEIRYCRNTGKDNFYFIPNGGWHFTFIGGVNEIQEKLKAFAHQEYNVKEITQDVDYFKNGLIDFYTNSPDWIILDDYYTLPKEIKNNIGNYKNNIISSNNIKYSIVIGTYNHLRDCLIPCIESIIKYTDLSNKEIIVIPNGCTDDTISYLNTLMSQGYPIRYFEYTKAQGFPKAYNRGIEEARGEYIILLNNDTILLPQKEDTWIEILNKPFKEDNKVGVTGPLELWSESAKSKFLVFFCVMIHKKLFDIVGYLDEDFGVGAGEDTSFCIEATKKGFKCLQVPEQKQLEVGNDFMVGNFPIWHKGEATMNDLPNWNEIFENNSNLLKQRYDNNQSIL